MSMYGNETMMLKISNDRSSDCWLWNGFRDKNGYGKFGLFWAHRRVYEFVKGDIPKGMQLDHLCRIPPCVNPDHLEIVTRKENLRRSPYLKLDAQKVLEIKRSYEKKKVSTRFLAKKFGVCSSHISRIITGQKWKDIRVADQAANVEISKQLP